MQHSGNLYPPTAPKHEEDDALADLRLLSSFGGEDASQIRPLRASGAGGCDVIKVPLLEDIQVGIQSQKLDLNQSGSIDSIHRLINRRGAARSAYPTK